VKPKSCYVSTPYGTKTDQATGAAVDFEAVYQTITRPAVLQAGLVPIRGDDIGGAIVHKGLLEAIISADVFLADITTANPNVMYELGIRHALRRGATVVMTLTGSRPPYDLSYIRYLAYSPSDIGEGSASASIRGRLAAVLSESRGRQDSPVHEFFPDLRIVLPPTLRTVEEQSVRDAIVEQLGTTAAPPIDLPTAVDALRQRRNRSDWTAVVSYADALPEPLRTSSEVRQIVALALNRRAGPGDRERAIAMMREVVAKTGGDSETYGILGRIYKDGYEEGRDPKLLAEAIGAYRAGFHGQPTDYYLALNLTMLLAQSRDPAAQGELERLVPLVRALMRERMDSNRASDSLELSAALQLAVLDGDYEAAAELGRQMQSQPAAAWVLPSTLRSLRELHTSAMDRAAVERLISGLPLASGLGPKVVGE
jgi:hypothetical protein